MVFRLFQGAPWAQALLGEHPGTRYPTLPTTLIWWINLQLRRILRVVMQLWFRNHGLSWRLTSRLDSVDNVFQVLISEISRMLKMTVHYIMVVVSFWCGLMHKLHHAVSAGWLFRQRLLGGVPISWHLNGWFQDAVIDAGSRTFLKLLIRII